MSPTQVFPLVAGRGQSFWVVGGLSILLSVGVAALLGYVMWSTRSIRCELSERGLIVHAPLYGRTIPLNELKAAEAKLVTLERDSPYGPVLRTNGVAMPGLRLGWFKLKKRERALLFLTGHGPVVYVPTTRHYSLLLTPQDEKAFLNALHTLASPSE